MTIDKFEYKKLLGIKGTIEESTLKDRYEEKYNNIVGDLKYIENIRSIKNITIFDKYTEGIELLKYAEKVTIIKGVYKNLDKKTIKRINKLRKINKNVNIKIEDELQFGGGGLMSLVAFSAQDFFLCNK